MKKVLEGHRYDTDTAREIGHWHNMEDGSDFKYCAETLYRTKAGLYFLYGEGGPMSRYAEARGQNNWGYGEKIIPMDEPAARAWAEDHLTGDEVEAAFELPAENSIAVTVYLPSSVLEKLDSAKGSSGRTDVVIAALRAYLKK